MNENIKVLREVVEHDTPNVRGAVAVDLLEKDWHELSAAAADLTHWATRYIMAIEDQFGKQPLYGTGTVGNLRAACDKMRLILGNIHKPDWRESAYEAAREPEGT